MPDISMCSGLNCPMAKSCYRHTAKPSPYRQSFFLNPPIQADGTCRYYWPTKEKKDERPESD